ncbi:hypothetical protein RFI_05603 [Reticulomyxa filosa]|uniref:RNase H type-1 domain-containing protein n=1 Tax=Reticulomyxa filosa TaxID=46433 RepID=X6P0B8_RETFI|nr:hypothetical protein RFI_05603 [Reticulomyxa filosa]|eukprot:ETO31519.1 hypothetical protein RFI_05603 [Reticulomyxa filosa]
MIMPMMDADNLHEIYCIKGYSGITGNEKAYQVAKRARESAQGTKHDIFQRPDKSALFLNAHGLDHYFTLLWNRHWTNEDNERYLHKHLKKYIRNLIEGNLFKRLSFIRAQAPECDWRKNEPETVDHFLMKCPQYNELRMKWFAAAANLIPELDAKTMELKHLLIGNKKWSPATRVKIVKELTKFVVATRRTI